MIRILFPILVLISLTIYLGASLAYGFLGFPLDDAWIHQTFARTLAQYGQWAFSPGQPSAGSTSPLWTIFLVSGHTLPVDPRFWTYLLGAGLLLFTAVMGFRLGQRLFPDQKLLPSAFAILLLLEWHLNWAAFSGMEILLFTGLSLLMLERYLAGVRPLGIGLLGGLLTLTRPEGALLSLITAIFYLQAGRLKREWKPTVQFSSGFALLIIPYLAFHFLVAGNPLPNTFYAKHLEYQSSFSPWWQRPLEMTGVTLVGAQALLLPGFIWGLWQIGRRAGAQRGWLIILSWWASLLLAYTVYLPLTYQHGRYLMPSIPFFVLLGLWGSWRLFSKANWVIRQTMLWATTALLVVFWARGALAYATDVRIIETELVAAARWLQANTSSQAVVAAHDIGAIGYFAERRLVDTAGLITPQVIPFIRDEDRLLTYLEEKKVDYFVTFPSWYPKIAHSPKMHLAWVSPSPWSREEGGENMAIYATDWGSGARD